MLNSRKVGGPFDKPGKKGRFSNEKLTRFLVEEMLRCGLDPYQRS